MEAVFGLLVMIVGVSHGMLTSSCDAREDGCQCYGALGGTVYLQLTDTTVSELTFKKDPTGVTTEILRMRRNKMIIADSIKARSEFFMNNRTFRMDNTKRTDSDQYLLETFHSNGSSLATRRLHLFIEDVQLVRQLHHPQPQGSPKGGAVCPTHHRGQTTCPPGQLKHPMSQEGLKDHEGQQPPEPPSHCLSPRYHPEGEGLIFVNCTLSTGTKISGWVNATDDAQCVEATTGSTVKNDINNPTVIQFHCQLTAGATGPGFSVFVYFQLAEVFILLTICLGLYCFYKKKTCP